MTTLVNDTFTGANGTNCVGRTPSPTTAGFNWASFGDAGTWQIQSNACQQQIIPTPLQDYKLVVDCGVADVTYTCDFTGAAIFNGSLVGNFVDANNFWEFGLQSTGGITGFINEVVSGTSTQRASYGASPAAPSAYAMKMVTSGDTITAFVGGVQVMTYTVAGRSNKTVTKFGFRQANVSMIFSSPLFDNFLVSSNATTYNDTITETITGSDAESGSSTGIPSLSETSTGSDTASASATDKPTFSETATGSDTNPGTTTTSQSLTETVTESDSVTTPTVYTNTITETVSANDNYSGSQNSFTVPVQTGGAADKQRKKHLEWLEKKRRKPTALEKNKNRYVEPYVKPRVEEPEETAIEDKIIDFDAVAKAAAIKSINQFASVRPQLNDLSYLELTEILAQLRQEDDDEAAFMAIM